MTPVIRKRGFDFEYFEGKHEFREAVHDCMLLAQATFANFNIDPIDVPVLFFNKGFTSGCVKHIPLSSGNIYNLEFNTVAIKSDMKEMIEQTIPHEVGHIIDIEINGKSDHGPIWKKIVRELGGTPSRTHNIDMSANNKKRNARRAAVYVASCGTTINISMRMHHNIQHRKCRSKILQITGGDVSAHHFTGRYVNTVSRALPSNF